MQDGVNEMGNPPVSLVLALVLDNSSNGEGNYEDGCDGFNWGI